MGSKYQVQALMDEAVNILRTQFPNKTSRIKSLRSRETPPIQDTGILGGKWIYIFRLVHNHSLVEFIPWCLYMCMQLPEEMLVEGIIGPDGKRETIPKAYLILCMKGMRHLIHASLAIADCIRTEGIVCGSDRCREEMAIWENKRVFSELKNEFWPPDPLGVRNALYPMGDRNFCKKCKRQIKNVKDREQQSLLDSLGPTLGL